MKNVFVTSDTHFGHANIIRYCNRPFVDVSAMNESLVERWNAVVGPDDIVYHLGDFAFLPIQEIRALIPRLNGHMKLVPGNHDKQMKKINSGDSMQLGTHLFEMMPAIYDFEWDGTKYVMCHFPMEHWEGRDKGTIHLHGHTHGNTGKHPTSLIAGRYDIGVDVYGGPIRLSLESLNNPKGW